MCPPPPLHTAPTVPTQLTHSLEHHKSWQGITSTPPRAVQGAVQKPRRKKVCTGLWGVPRVEKVWVGGGGGGNDGDPLTPPSALLWQIRGPAVGALLRGHHRPTSCAPGRCQRSFFSYHKESFMILSLLLAAGQLLALTTSPPSPAPSPVVSCAGRTRAVVSRPADSLVSVSTRRFGLHLNQVTIGG